MTGLHTSEIECLARRVCLPPVKWLGVFARDQLPDLTHVPRPFALVFNTDPHNKPGQHWLAIYGSRDGPLELFDSFGMPPSYYGFTISFIYSPSSFQSLASELCGNYTLYFICLRSRNISFNQIISFLKSITDPDNYIKNYVFSLQKEYRTLNPCLRTGQCCTAKCSFC